LPWGFLLIPEQTFRNLLKSERRSKHAAEVKNRSLPPCVDFPTTLISRRKPTSLHQRSLHGGKDIENRTWKTNYRGPLLILASKQSAAQPSAISDSIRHKVRFGGVVGIACVVDCVTVSRSGWFKGPFGFVLADRRPLPFVPWRGALGLRDVPEELIVQIGRSYLEDYLAAEAASVARARRPSGKLAASLGGPPPMCPQG
jgi:hypothetical protein